MLCSLNEIRALAAGAARWLEARGLAGLAALEGALEHLAAADWRRCFPVPQGAVWRGESGEIDGLLAGITLADRADGPLPFASGGALVLARVRGPLLAAPFLAGVAEVFGARLAVSAGAGTPVIGIGPQSASESCRALEGMALAKTVRIAKAGDGAMPPDLPRLDGSIPVDSEVYARLARRAARTHVPESDESRARGAGAGNPVETD